MSRITSYREVSPTFAILPSMGRISSHRWAYCNSSMREREHEITAGGVKYLGSSQAKPIYKYRVINVYQVRLTGWAPLITAIMLIKRSMNCYYLIYKSNTQQTQN